MDRGRRTIVGGPWSMVFRWQWARKKAEVGELEVIDNEMDVRTLGPMNSAFSNLTCLKYFPLEAPLLPLDHPGNWINILCSGPHNCKPPVPPPPPARHTLFFPLPTTPCPLPTAHSEPPTAYSQPPTTNHRPWTTDYRPSSTVHGPLTAHCQLPTITLSPRNV